MKSCLFSLLFICLNSIAFSQEPPDSQQTQAALKVKQLIEKKATYNKLNNGEYDGYRIKIYFGVDRVKRSEVKTKFGAKFADITPYEDYEQPNFILTVGDFRTKLEAFEALKKVQVEFPNSFIIKSKIRPMKV